MNFCIPPPKITVTAVHKMYEVLIQFDYVMLWYQTLSALTLMQTNDCKLDVNQTGGATTTMSQSSLLIAIFKQVISFAMLMSRSSKFTGLHVLYVCVCQLYTCQSCVVHRYIDISNYSKLT